MPAAANATLIVINQDGMGNAEPELRHKLITTYLTLLNDNNMLPGAICFYTDGVRLACDGSPILEALEALEEKGVHLILCQTCLDYFGLAEQVRVGIVGGMGDIITAMWQADTVISL